METTSEANCPETDDDEGTNKSPSNTENGPDSDTSSVAVSDEDVPKFSTLQLEVKMDDFKSDLDLCSVSAECYGVRDALTEYECSKPAMARNEPNSYSPSRSFSETYLYKHKDVSE